MPVPHFLLPSRKLIPSCTTTERRARNIMGPARNWTISYCPLVSQQDNFTDKLDLWLSGATTSVMCTIGIILNIFILRKIHKTFDFMTFTLKCLMMGLGTSQSLYLVSKILQNVSKISFFVEFFWP